MLIRRDPEELAVTWSFATDVHKSISGKERRIANRSVPLERLSARFLLADDASDVELATLRAALFVDPVSAIQIPLRIDGRPTTNEVTADSVEFDATYADWVAVDQAVYIEGRTADDYLATTITVVGGSVGARVLTLADSVPAGDFPAGFTTISPIASVLADDRVPLARFQESHGQIQINGIVSNTWAAYGTGAALTTHNGLFVVTEAPVMGGDFAEEQFDAAAERIESLPGAVTQIWTRDRADIARLHRFSADGEAERQWWRKFLYTVRGKQAAFRLPTWRPDLTYDSHVGAALTIAAPTTAGAVDYVNDYWPSTAHRCIRVMRTTGATTFYTVSAAVDNMDGTADLTLNAAFVATDLDYISLVETCRLAADEVTFQRGSTFFDVELPVIVIQQDAVGSPATFAELEQSVQSSRPIELVKITGDGVAYYMTGERAAITYATHVYEATPGLARAELERTGNESPRELEITLPLSCDFAQEQVWSPSEDLEVTVYRQQGAATVPWYGPVPITSVRIAGGMCKVRAPSLLDDPLRANVPSVHYHRLVCPHRVFDANCARERLRLELPAIAATGFDLPTNIDTISGRTITVPSVGLFADGDLNGGDVVHSSGASKMIVSHVGTTLVLASPGRGWAVDDDVTLIRGCDKKIETCEAVFNNVENYGGHPRMPRASIFEGGINGAWTGLE